MRHRFGRAAVEKLLPLAPTVAVLVIGSVLLVSGVEKSSGEPMEDSPAPYSREQQLRNLGVPEDEWQLEEPSFSQQVPQPVGDESESPVQVVSIVVSEEQAD
ncbi:hypothetical protein Q9S78_02135 [Microbacterium sp. KSW-18]|uniref:Uncharacterized protein n=1 Tax=Microbacterium aquilitoris TaxID=3067307 RepID=A0ABU3GFI7_9MICO|nr:hypothetical protein [Microbacterium sp. KSW-18]MDT3329458.1 hypothetical protein [Microbacterium sp. KSW-18]